MKGGNTTDTNYLHEIIKANNKTLEAKDETIELLQKHTYKLEDRINNLETKQQPTPQAHPILTQKQKALLIYYFVHTNQTPHLPINHRRNLSKKQEL